MIFNKINIIANSFQPFLFAAATVWFPALSVRGISLWLFGGKAFLVLVAGVFPVDLLMSWLCYKECPNGASHCWVICKIYPSFRPQILTFRGVKKSFETPKNTPKMPLEKRLITSTIFLSNSTQVLTKFYPSFMLVEDG